MIMQVTEGEQVPPPILRAAFQRHPFAEKGWNACTKAQRRNHLLSVFLAQGVESRQRRVDYVTDKCLEIARRRKGPAGKDEARFEFD